MSILYYGSDGKIHGLGDKNMLAHYNHNHDKLGRFAKSSISSGVNNSSAKDKKIDVNLNKRNQEIKFGGNNKCLIVLDTNNWPLSKKSKDSMKKRVDSVLNDPNLHKELQRQAADNLYEYRLNESLKQSKEEYTKKMACQQITFFDNEDGYYDPEISDSGPDCVIWYSNPDDFGDWMFEYNTRLKKITYQQSYR